MEIKIAKESFFMLPPVFKDELVHRLAAVDVLSDVD
jgi:hypothetical protein